ncbi:MAG TPA: DUF4258 domain-containing protein [Patescibacteria group bacterium]|nr:DUF4258 domain-containing protein [Patescibacteria group bacterium]
MDRNFGGVIWTNHAIDRMRQRGIKQGDAWAAWRNPEQTRQGEKKGIWVYYRTYGNERIEVVATQNERKEWVILSVWSRKQSGKNDRNPSFLAFIIRKIFKKQHPLKQ